MIYESETVELKEILKEDISKEVVAFANTEGGTIYIGIDDMGNEVGIQNVDESYTCLQISSVIPSYPMLRYLQNTSC